MMVKLLALKKEKDAELNQNTKVLNNTYWKKKGELHEELVDYIINNIADLQLGFLGRNAANPLLWSVFRNGNYRMGNRLAG